MPTASGTGTMPPAHRGPEAVEKLLVVAEEDDHLVAALRTHRLQVVQNPERARINLAVEHAALGILAFDVGDGAIDAAVVFENLQQGRVRHRSSTVIMRLERGRRLICASSSMGPLVGARQAKAAHHAVHVDQHLEHRHVLADAVPRADGEWDIGEAVPLLGVHAGEALGLKFLGLAPEGRVPMQRVGADEHIGARGDGKPPSSSASIVRRVNSHPGGYSRSDSCSTWWVNASDSAASRPRVSPVVRSASASSCAAVSGCWLMRYQRPGERRGGGLVTGDDQGEHLVDQLLVAHRGVIVAVARGHEHAQEIDVLFGFAAPPLDQFGDQLAERAEAERELQVPVLFLGDDLERIGAQLPLQALEIGAEYRAQHDLEGEFARIVGEVDRLAARRLRGPSLGEFLVHFVNQAAEPVDHAPVKTRLHHAPLAPPEVALAGHDAVAEQDLDPIHALALGVIAMIRQQHVLDVVGMIDDVVVHAARRSEHAIDIAEAREILAQLRQRFVAPAEVEALGRPGRKGRGLHPRIVSQWPPRTG